MTPIVDRVCSLDRIPDELRRLHAGDARGKIVVRVHPVTAGPTGDPPGNPMVAPPS